ncbi:uncharacterized protein PHACADRAFT_251919 [Phanerochaete carnosa HHB-10118-sp]|uniref:Uncharacterized protein n=1 Tax=Phanerochaete carnosa (strain HHB-10118-sp) TaxID=650164 RepID=K5V5N5_PHACS|nr:uncharacterized protein PHACADRAFT_251919 [Phanerochaete carnosa HHB-10118-sp]EKM57981.1 hypothetical protein PHACADRAFT_251919 [Phanerochaete carnosa HHB-10118-sp]
MSKLVKTAVGDIGPMHERSKKAGVHCIAYVAVIFPFYRRTFTPAASVLERK